MAMCRLALLAKLPILKRHTKKYAVTFEPSAKRNEQKPEIQRGNFVLVLRAFWMNHYSFSTLSSLNLQMLKRIDFSCCQNVLTENMYIPLTMMQQRRLMDVLELLHTYSGVDNTFACIILVSVTGFHSFLSFCFFVCLNSCKGLKNTIHLWWWSKWRACIRFLHQLPMRFRFWIEIEEPVAQNNSSVVWENILWNEIWETHSEQDQSKYTVRTQSLFYGSFINRIILIRYR